MANIAQTVNVLQAVILTAGKDIVRTPTYHAFAMYVPFQDSTFVPLESKDIPLYAIDDVTVPQVSASSALTKDGNLVLALVNLHATDELDITAEIEGYKAHSAVARVLTGSAIDAHNTFDDPDSVTPTALAVELSGNRVLVRLPARSVSVVKLAR